MTREEAKKLIGQRVEAWTAMNGTYTGVLVDVIVRNRKPWRGLVRIDGVLKCWCVFEISRLNSQRTGLTIGQEYEFGGINIIPTEKIGATKRQILENEIKNAEEWLEHRSNYRPDVPKNIIREAKRQLERIS